MTEPKPEPQSVYGPLIMALDNMVREQGETRRSIDGLSSAVLNEAEARDHKVQELQRATKVTQRLTAVMIAGILILLTIAGLNLINTTRTNGIAKDAQSTNELLVGCFTPGSECQKVSQAQQKAQNDQVRQTVFVLFACSRLNPADPDNPDPEGNTKKLVTCVQQYYPDFQLPQPVK